MTTEQDIANSIAGRLGNAPKLHELDDGETARLSIRYVKSKRKLDGVAVSFHFGTGTSETVEEIADIVEPQLDKRKFRVSEDQPLYKQNDSWDIGWVEVDNQGDVVAYDIDTAYLKPTEQ